VIHLQQVIKLYSRRGETITAFQCADLTIAAGEYVAVVGPSGSGKTTLLSLLGGMLSPTQGEVLVGGQSLYQLSPAARSALRSEKMGFVFQTFNLIPYLTALQNVQIPLCLSRLSATRQAELATQQLERFGLSDRLHHHPAELSVGQQQRVALARTLVNSPQVIFADEPTGNLDPESREVYSAPLMTAIAKAGRS
jgi:putative ABC transport system ATP-binding protein